LQCAFHFFHKWPCKLQDTLARQSCGNPTPASRLTPKMGATAAAAAAKRKCDNSSNSNHNQQPQEMCLQQLPGSHRSGLFRARVVTCYSYGRISKLFLIGNSRKNLPIFAWRTAKKRVISESLKNQCFGCHNKNISQNEECHTSLSSLLNFQSNGILIWNFFIFAIFRNKSDLTPYKKCENWSKNKFSQKLWGLLAFLPSCSKQSVF